MDAGAAIEMLRSGLENLKDSLAQALDKSGADLVDAAQSIVPVRTGFLRSSIHYDVEELTLTFEAAAPYAKYVEFGHHTRGGKHVVAPRPFMRPAYYQLLPQIQDELATAAANAFNG